MKLPSFLTKVFALILLLSTQVFAAPDFLPPEKAFRVEATWLANSKQLEIEFIPAKGYYLYQESLQFQIGTQPEKLSNIRPILPLGIEKFDETFQKKMQVYKETFLITLVKKAEIGKPLYLELELQG
jgi:thiol:disulfide interchange protein DsbD